MIYFDNAATSFPKPEGVRQALLEALDGAVNPGRSAHALAMETARRIYAVRKRIADHIGAAHPGHVVFTKNCTEALNIAIRGALAPGDHVVTTVFEHNSILRPLNDMRLQGVEITHVRPQSGDVVTPEDILAAIEPHTRMVVLAHTTNLTGATVDIAAIGRALPEGILFCVDGAQSLGSHAIEVENWGIDFFAAPGHKGIFGVMGTGFLYIRDGASVTTMMSGGTGSRSSSLVQPDILPDKFEAGTLGAHGIYTLGAGLDFVEERGLDAIAAHLDDLSSAMEEGLRSIEGVVVYGDHPKRSIVSMNISDMDSGDVAMRLDRDFGIATRAQLHCAPLAHLYFQTLETGMVRFSFSPMNTREEVEEALRAVRVIAREKDHDRMDANA